MLAGSGKMLGGSSGVNGMLFDRGAASDYVRTPNSLPVTARFTINAVFYRMRGGILVIRAGDGRIFFPTSRR